MSTLGYAILGLLAAQPRTGYDLARLMRTPIGYMWTAHHSQIYPELARLEGEALVAATVIDGPGPRDTKRYEITPAGWHVLQDWVDSPLSEVARSEFMLRIRGLWLLPPERARAFLLKQREWYASRLATYAMEEATFLLEDDAVDDPTSYLFAEYATLRYGIMRVRETIAWCDWLLDRLDRFQPIAADTPDATSLVAGQHPADSS
jgi:DNA-binding PadR family transcriptional regulator